MNEDQIQVTYEELQRYADECYQISQQLIKLCSIADEMVKLQASYEGEGKTVVNNYYLSFQAHMMSLTDFYTKAYLNMLYIAREMKFTDDEIAKLIAQSITKNGDK